MIPTKLKTFLDDRGVAYQVITHANRPTAMEASEAAGIPERRFAKAVLLREEDGRFLLALLPASEKIDQDRLTDTLGRPVRLASEEDMRLHFGEWEVGALPPFTDLLGVPIIADLCLEASGFVGFRAGTHTDIIEMHWSDFARLARPDIFDYGRPRWPAPQPQVHI